MLEQNSLIYGLMTLGSQAKEERKPLTIRTNNLASGEGETDHRVVLDTITPLRDDVGELQGVKARFIRLHAGEPLFPFTAERNFDEDYDPKTRIIKGVDFGWDTPEFPQSFLAEAAESQHGGFVKKI